MQKKIIALAIAAAFAAPAVAMADVTVYGVLDGGFRSVTANSTTSNTMGSGTKDSNRFGIKSSEELGDGMKANVNLEGDIVTGTGAANATTLFSRNATVGLEGGFGKVDLGHQYTVAFKLNTLIDPFGHQYIGITSANAASGMTFSATTVGAGGGGAVTVSTKNITRNDSDISYTGKFGDVTVMADKAMGAANSDGSGTAAVGVSYASGPITVVASYTKVKASGVAATGQPAALVTSDMTHTQLGAGFNFGDGSVKVGYAAQSNPDQGPFAGTGTNTAAGTSGWVSSAGYTLDVKTIWLGGDYNISSKINVAAGYYKTTSSYTGTTDLVTTNMVAAVKYALSKKTAMYVEADKLSVDNGSTTTDANGYALGVSVAF